MTAIERAEAEALVDAESAEWVFTIRECVAEERERCAKIAEHSLEGEFIAKQIRGAQ